MVQKIIGFCGTSQAGKSMCANFLGGTILSKLKDEDGNPVVENWRLNDLGLLEIEADIQEEDGTISKDFSVLSWESRDPSFAQWANAGLWRFVKPYSLATPLKENCMSAFGLTYQQIFGDQKYTETGVTWGMFSNVLDTKEKKRIKEAGLTDTKMLARDVMEYYGTKILRGIDPDIFPKRLCEQLDADSSYVGVITDVRRLNEAKILQEKGAIIVRLLRGNPPNISEIDIDEITPSFVIDNRDLSQEETCAILADYIESIGLFSKPE